MSTSISKLPKLSTRVLDVVALRGGQALPCLMVGGHGLERGVAHAGGRRVGGQQLVVPGLKAPVIEPAGQIAETVLDRVPQLVHDVAVDTRRR